MLRVSSLLSIAVLLLSCAGEADRSATRERPSSPTAQGERLEPPRAKLERNIILTAPRDGAMVKANPILIEGRARTFENHVEIRVDDAGGQPIATRHGTARGDIGRFNPFSEEIFLTVDPGSKITITAIERSARDGSIRTSHAITLGVDGRTMPIRLYFPNADRGGVDCSVVDPVVRDVPTSISSARLALEALLRGPTQPEAVAGFRNPFPQGAAVRSVNLKGGTLTVDFNQAMQNVGGSCRVLSIRASIEATMKAIPGIERAVITAMGDEKTALQP